MPKIQILSGDKNCWYRDCVGKVVEVDKYFVYDNDFYSLLPTEWNRKNLLRDDFKYLKETGLIVNKKDASLINGIVYKTNQSKPSPNVKYPKFDLILPFDDVQIEEEESLKSANARLDKLENQGSIESINKLIEARKTVDALRSLNIGSEADFEDMESEIKNNIKKYLEKIGIKGLDIL